jgi:hypothetical protein
MASEPTILVNRPDSAPSASTRPPGGSSSIPPKSPKACFLAQFEPSSRPAQRLEGEGTVPQADEPDLVMRAMLFLGGIFARLPGGERCEFIEAMRRLIAELEHTLSQRVDAERRPIPPKSLLARLLARLEPSSRPAQRLEGEGTVPPVHEPDLILRAMRFLRRTFARLSGGERHEFIASIRDLMDDLERELSAGEEAEPPSVAPAGSESAIPPRIDPPLAAINKEDQDPPPNSADPSTESTAKDPATEIMSHVRDLISNIARLSRSGEDPGRLSDLKRELDDFQLRQIELGLSLFERKSDPAGLREREEAVAAANQPYNLALRRTDLTVPELIFLYKWNEKILEEMRKSLLADKEAIERRRFPWMRRRRRRVL